MEISSYQLSVGWLGNIFLFYDGICGNFYYKQARDINQLGRVRIYNVKNGLKKYMAKKIEDGQKLGDIKPVVVDKGAGWFAYLINGEKQAN